MMKQFDLIKTRAHIHIFCIKIKIRMLSSLHYKQNMMLKMPCIFVSNFVGWWDTGRLGASEFLFLFLLLSWKNCCITSAHSVANIPRRIAIFGWKGWTGAGGLSVDSDPVASSPPLGNSLHKGKLSNSINN